MAKITPHLGARNNRLLGQEIHSSSRRCTEIDVVNFWGKGGSEFGWLRNFRSVVSASGPKSTSDWPADGDIQMGLLVNSPFPWFPWEGHKFEKKTGVHTIPPENVCSQLSIVPGMLQVCSYNSQLRDQHFLYAVALALLSIIFNVHLQLSKVWN